MGLRSSKLIITPETKASAAAPETAVVVAKELVENGNTEAIPSIDGATTEPNGDCTTSPADDTAATIPAVEECPDSKKKKHRIDWIQKKISFKKLRTPKKAAAKEPEHTPESAPQTVPEESEKKTEEEKPVEVAVAGDVQTQAEEVPKVDQSTEHPESHAQITESETVVEIIPTENGVSHHEDEEHFVEDEVATVPEVSEEKEEDQKVEEVEESAPEPDHEESNTDLGLAEKLANLGIDSIQSVPENGIAEATATNGDSEVHHD